MSDPFFIDGPATLSVSGGRTSSYMLRRILDAHDGELPEDVIVLFANTGKEMPQTLDFVQECSERWNVPITWLEYRDADAPADRWRVVDHASASRNGEPFEAVIRAKNYLPNPVTRFCTSELKVKAMHRFIRATRGWDAWISVVGIRADEPRRIAKIAAPNRDRDERYAPLGRAGISAADVGAFWRTQPFDLRLPNMNGRTMHGNCDLCFLKGGAQKLSLIRENPERAVWWARMESDAVQRRSAEGLRNPRMALFRSDQPSYAQLLAVATDQGEMFDVEDTLDECACTD